MPRDNDPRWCSLDFAGYTRQPALLGDVTFLEQTFDRVVQMAGMRVLDKMGKHVELELEKLNAPAFEDEGGYSCCWLISTSHLCYHGWPERGCFMFQVVSCRRFDAHAVHRFLVEALQVTNGSHYQVKDHIRFSEPSLHVTSG